MYDAVEIKVHNPKNSVSQFIWVTVLHFHIDAEKKSNQIEKTELLRKKTQRNSE